MSLKNINHLEVYCIAGLPITKVSEEEIIFKIVDSCLKDKKLVINTPNLSFLRLSNSNEEFYSSLIRSDILVADGMPIIWIAKLLNLPITERIAGASILTKITSELKQHSLKVFYFGGKEGVAKKAHKITNSIKSSTKSVGYLYPDFGSVEDLSLSKFINKINSSKTNIILVSLPAYKGVRWINKNIKKLSINIAISSGTTINFISGELKRAPELFQHNGLEWLWRVKQEPRLIRRYFLDFLWLCYFIIFRICPILFYTFMYKLIYKNYYSEEGCLIKNENQILKITLPKSCRNKAAEAIRSLNTFEAKVDKIIIDAKETNYIDARFTGELILLQTKLLDSNKEIHIINRSYIFNLLILLMGAKDI